MLYEAIRGRAGTLGSRRHADHGPSGDRGDNGPVGRTPGGHVGRRSLPLVGFAALPIRALVFAWTTNPIILIAAQLLDGVSGTMLGVLATLIVANLTPYWPVQPSAGLRRDDIRSRFRSARYFQVSWPGALAARLDFWHRRNSGGSRASRVVADA